ncbi:MAG: hypothetical protein GEU98_10660 [Pseudonocardiaceae bacterium]|nr:hypothetical protein [Pseudonocardiaceae bacterium]
MASNAGGVHFPGMDEVRRELAARLDRALSSARSLRERVDEIDRKLRDTPDPPAPGRPSDEEVARFRKFILGYAWTPAWRPVIDRIDRGELTWRQVAESGISGMPDPGIAAAFASSSTLPPPNTEQLAEIGALRPEQPAGHETRHDADPGTASEPTPKDSGAGRFFDIDDDDQWWYDNRHR